MNSIRVWRKHFMSSCSFEVYSISFKLGRSSNSRFLLRTARHDGPTAKLPVVRTVLA